MLEVRYNLMFLPKGYLIVLANLFFHSVSKGVPLEKFVDGCKVLMDFVTEVYNICSNMKGLLRSFTKVLGSGGSCLSRPNQGGRHRGWPFNNLY